MGRFICTRELRRKTEGLEAAIDYPLLPTAKCRESAGCKVGEIAREILSRKGGNLPSHLDTVQRGSPIRKFPEPR